MEKDESKTNLKTLITSWTAFVIVSILFLLIFRFTFGWNPLGDQWWIWFPVGGTLLGAIITTITYSVSKKSD